MAQDFSLSAYIPFAVTSFKKHMKEAKHMIVRFCACVFFMIVFVELWRLIGREGFIDLPYSVTDLSWYVCFTQMFLFMSSRIFLVIEHDVRSGDIAYFMVRPVSYMTMKFWEGLGAMTASTLPYYTLGIGVLYYYIGDFPSGGIVALLSAMMLMYVGSILHLMFQLITGISALWLQESEPFYRLYQKGLIILGGLYMPISLYPDWVGKIASMTPFYAMLYGAIKPVLGHDANILSSVTYLGVWIIVAWVLMIWVYRSCTQRLELNGG